MQFRFLVKSLKVFFLKLVLIFFCISSFSSISYSQIYPNKEVHQIIINGIEAICNHKYDNAKLYFSKLDKNFSDFPAAKYFLALTEIEKANDLGLQLDIKLINYYLSDAEENLQNQILKNPNDPWSQFYLGLVIGFKAYHQLSGTGWLSAITSASSSSDCFEKCIEIDSSFSEALGYLGNYKYWKSKKTEWVPFIKDEKQVGINFIKKAIKRESYSNYLFRNSLFWIYIEEKKFNSALEFTRESISKFNSCRLFKWNLARVYEEIDLNESIKVYNEILYSYIKENNLTNLNNIIIKHKIAQNYYKMGKNDLALKLVNEIIAINSLTDYEKERLSDRIERIKKMKIELLKKLNK